MLKFLDGPAGGQTIACRRAPVFLRVVRDKDGHWDALDQVNDHPTPDEAVWVYYRVAGTLSGAFICSRGSKAARAASGYHQIAQYRYHPEQPEDDLLRDYYQWGMWAEQEYQRILARKTMKREGRHR